MTRQDTAQRALAALTAVSATVGDAARALAALEAAGISLADAAQDELVVRWVDTREQSVPPEADTIIRTITRTVEGETWSTTHWLDGLRSPVTTQR